MTKKTYETFPSAKEVAQAAKLCVSSPQTESPAYRLAYLDSDFLLSDELRPVRLQLELLKPELAQQQAGIESTVVVFGSARIQDPAQASKELDEARLAVEKKPADPQLQQRVKSAERAMRNSHYYQEAQKFAQTLSDRVRHNGESQYVVITGGGPGIMEAANRGAAQSGAKTIGLNIVLPMEQAPNPYITPDLCFQFHYFAIRKMHFLMRARALVAFPGGFGTLDELFEALTLIQTQKIEPIPVLLFGRSYWERVLNFPALVEEGMISSVDLSLFHYVESAEEACRVILADCQQGESSAKAAPNP